MRRVNRRGLAPVWRRSATAARVAVVCLGVTAGCQADPATTVLLNYDAFADPRIGTLQGVRAELEVLAADDRQAVARVDVPDSSELVESPFPMQCVAGTCSLSFAIAPGAYRFTLRVFAADRCGTTSLIGVFRPEEEGAIRLGPYGSTALSLSRADFTLDDDDDGLVNVFEVQTCGRFDWNDGALGPSECTEGDVCCDREEGSPFSSDLVGRMARFPGGTYPGPAPATMLDVDPFWLDATEATWGQLARCVGAGACLALADASHPSLTELQTAAFDEPAIGLTPAEAAEFCAWAGRRLPTDDEWDFAAAWRPGGSRAEVAWDGAGLLLAGSTSAAHDEPLADEELPVTCRRSSSAVSANYRELGEDCDRFANPVGRRPTSHIWRADGPPIADLVGNVWEWTALPGDPPPGSGLPDGVAGVRLRGGGYDSGERLLRTDFALDFDPRSPSFEDDIDQVRLVAGVRCAADDDAEPALEPRCPDLE